MPPARAAARAISLRDRLRHARAARRATRDFWLLFATFFICGFTTNGLVGTHLIAFCGDHGIAEVHAAGLLAMMGVFDLFGTTVSGWLTDRFDRAQAAVRLLRPARALAALPALFRFLAATALSIFAVFYGLDWIATVPPASLPKPPARGTSASKPFEDLPGRPSSPASRAGQPNC